MAVLWFGKVSTKTDLMILRVTRGFSKFTLKVDGTALPVLGINSHQVLVLVPNFKI